MIHALERSLVSRWPNVFSGEIRTAFRLLLRGFAWRREPTEVKGKRPDFMTLGRGLMWVEVKEIDQPPSQNLLGRAHEDLKERLESVDGNYGVQAWVTEEFDPRIARQAVGLLRRELQDGLDDQEQLVIAVPAGEYSSDVVELTWTSNRGRPIRFVTFDNEGSGYGCPSLAVPSDWIDEVEISNDQGSRTTEAFKIISDADSNALTFWVNAAEGHVGLGGVGSAEATQLNTVDRLRRNIEKAAKQLKSGQAHKNAPGIVEIYNDHLPANRDEVFAACFGDLNALFDSSTDHVSQFYGMNGVFRPNKNTAVSAVVYRSVIFEHVTVVNPHARFPVSRRWLDGEVVT